MSYVSWRPFARRWSDGSTGHFTHPAFPASALDQLHRGPQAEKRSRDRSGRTQGRPKRRDAALSPCHHRPDRGQPAQMGRTRARHDGFHRQRGEGHCALRSVRLARHGPSFCQFQEGSQFLGGGRLHLGCGKTGRKAGTVGQSVSRVAGRDRPGHPRHRAPAASNHKAVRAPADLRTHVRCAPQWHSRFHGPIQELAAGHDRPQQQQRRDGMHSRHRLRLFLRR